MNNVCWRIVIGIRRVTSHECTLYCLGVTPYDRVMKPYRGTHSHRHLCKQLDCSPRGEDTRRSAYACARSRAHIWRSSVWQIADTLKWLKCPSADRREAHPLSGPNSTRRLRTHCRNHTHTRIRPAAHTHSWLWSMVSTCPTYIWFVSGLNYPINTNILRCTTPQTHPHPLSATVKDFMGGGGWAKFMMDNLANSKSTLTQHLSVHRYQPHNYVTNCMSDIWWSKTNLGDRSACAYNGYRLILRNVITLIAFVSNSCTATDGRMDGYTDESRKAARPTNCFCFSSCSHTQHTSLI